VKAAHAPLACVARHRYDEVPRSMSALPIPILPAVARALLRVAAFAATLLLSAVASGQGWETGHQRIKGCRSRAEETYEP
jgi:hypothetical protein